MFKSLNVKNCSCWKDNKNLFRHETSLSQQQRTCGNVPTRPPLGLDKNKIELGTLKKLL